tara:strand:- start:613 stop:1401 length:789 start_codon:yes stop_codon:yes gene_type:complete
MDLFKNVIIILFSISQLYSQSKNDNWKVESQITKRIDNVNFNFPENFFDLDRRESLIKETFVSMKEISESIGLELKDTIYVRFVLTREDMKPLTNSKSTGMTYPHIKTCYLVLNDKVDTPLKHELTHLIVMLGWGYPHQTSIWMNEGLSTYQVNNCNGYSVSELYRYFLEKKKLIDTNSLTSNFYGNSEMISYHQSGQIVRYLLENYSVKQFEELWKTGLNNFQNIYGEKFLSIIDEMEDKLKSNYPDVIEFDFELFMEGCT